MSQLIALVPTAVMVDGVRTVVQPGEPLPALHPHDAQALVHAGAAEDAADVAAARAQAERDAADAAAQMQAARERVQAARDSVAPEGDAGTQAAAKPAAKAAKAAK